MIINGEPFEFEPFGRKILDSCKGVGPGTEEPPSKNVEKKEEQRPVFRVRKRDGSDSYEEIYGAGKTLVWSYNRVRLLRTFSTDFTIIDAFWHTFTVSTGPGFSETTNRPWDALCVVGEEIINIYRSDDGFLFQLTLPFPVHRVYSTEFGLLLERAVTASDLRNSKTSGDQLFPFLFSIPHPLNEIVPVICKMTDASGRDVIRYIHNLDMRVVHSDAQRSLLLTFDKKTGCHSLWSIRKASKQDAAAASEFLEQSVLSNASTVFSHTSLNSGRLTPSLARGAQFFNPSLSLSQSIIGPSSSSQQTTSLQQTTATTATTSLSSGMLPHLFAVPLSSTPEEQGFPLPLLPDLRSPASITRGGRLLGGPSARALTPRPGAKGGSLLTNPAVSRILRLNTSCDPSTSSFILTPRSGTTTTPKPGDLYQSYFPSPALNSYHAGDYMHMSTYGQSAVPFVPDLCLELRWSESISQTSRGDLQTLLTKADCPANKVVVVADFAGGVYLCYLISSLCQLRCLKIVKNKDSDQLAASGVPALIPCRDFAVFLDSKHLIVLDHNNALNLYNGVKKISPLYCDAMSLLSPPDKYASEFHKSHASRILSSSELPLSSDAMDCSLLRDAVDAIVSPVRGDLTNTLPTGPLNGMISAVDTFCEKSPHFLVILNSQRTCQCSIPTAESTPAVELCLKALKSVLPADMAVDLYSSWLGSRQLSSSSTTALDCSEILVFMKFIMEATGFPALKMFGQFGLGNDSVAEVPAKRSRCSEDGSDADWEYLVQNLRGTAIGDMFGIAQPEKPSKAEEEANEQTYVRTTAAFFSNLPTIFFALHSCYEEMKLNQLYWSDLEHFGKCLYVIAKTLQLSSYMDYYMRDFSDMSLDEPAILIDIVGSTSQLCFPPYWSSDCWSIYDHIYRLLKNAVNDKKPTTIISCCERLWTACMLYRVLRGEIRRAADVQAFILAIGEQTAFQKAFLHQLDMERAPTVSDVLAKLLRLAERNGGKETVGGLLSTFPPGVAAPLLLRLSPPQFRTIRSVDGPARTTDGPLSNRHASIQQSLCRERATAKLKSHDADGMTGCILNDELSKLLFPNDMRLLDVRSMLRSSKQTKISVKQRPGVADNEFREEQERHLYSVCVRTMALPIGRGMFTLRSHRPLLAESVEIPKLCLTGRTAGPQSLTIDLSHIDVPANMDLWAKFHNGVAAGLRVSSPESLSSTNDQNVEQQLDTAWIVYNMPRSSSVASSNDGGGAAGAPLTPEHAGFLFGLGLNGHLTNLALFNLHEYLVKGDAMTSIALLLGTAAAKCRTAELQSMKMLSMHLPFLLLPTLLELNIDPSVQTAAVLGVGLLYAESGNYRLSEALVREIGRPSTALNDNFADRESYALSCGFALGLITLGMGDLVFGDSNFTLASELCLLMNGGHKRAHHYATESPASQLVKDGDFLNVHVTSAPAIVALGLMYLKSSNHQVAAWFDPPETLALLDTVRPDFLLLRAISKSIILWDDILPRVDWVESLVPAVVLRYVNMSDEDRLLAIREQFVDLETVAQTFCSIVAGACFALALKFAGSANADAFKCLIHYYKMFDPFYQQKAPLSWRKMYTRAGCYTTENSLNVVVMALGAVMAGTGHLDVLRIVRHLRQRIGPTSNNWILHGGHMATHVALGLLYLGGGRYTLSTSNLSVAALFCALYPRFPISPNDNRFHLQAFRHLYVLACEPRLLITRDHLSQELAYCNISVKFKACQHYEATTETLRTPCILPELTLLEEVRINDERYWPKCYTNDQNWEELRFVLKSSMGTEICRRAGFCTRKDDPQGYQSMAALFGLHSEDWVPPPQQMSNNDSIEILESLKQWCAKRDCEHAYSNLADLFKLVNGARLRTMNIWQLKLLLAFAPQINPNGGSENGQEDVEFLLALEMKLRQQLSEAVSASALRSYIEKGDGGELEHCYEGGKTLLGEFLTFFDLPTRSFWTDARLRDYRNLRTFIEKFRTLNIPIVTAIILNRVLGRAQ